MFRSNDKVTLTLINARDINDQMLPFSLSVPVGDGSYDIPDTLAAIDVFEYQEGVVNQGYVLFHIYVGERKTFSELLELNGEKKVKVKRTLEILGIDRNICYQEVNGNNFVFATVDDCDVVVKDHEQLKGVIGNLSEAYTAVCTSVDNIKSFSKTMNSK